MKKHCYKRKDGRWQYAKQENGMRYYAIANTYRELLEKIKSIKPKTIRIIKNIKTKSLTFSQYFNYYIQTFVETQQYRSKTIQEWKNCAKNYIEPYFKNLSLTNIQPEYIQNFLNAIKKERTREIIYQYIIKVLKKAYVTEKMKKDITIALEKPKRINKQIRKPLTLEEQRMLIEKVKKTNLYAYVMFSLIIGSRREETIRFNLKNDINEEKLQIHIHGTKTKNADRYVNVSKEFIQFLKENMQTEKFNFNLYYPTKKIAQIFKDLNIQNCLHGLRHTCSANLYFLGAKDKYRQQQLGHSSIVITNDIYTHITENIPKAKLLEIYGNLYPSFD